MRQDVRGPVVIDTGVFSARLIPREKPLAEAYRPLLEGRPHILSFVTVAELRFGARVAGWGASKLHRLNYEVGRTEVVWPGPALTDTYAALRAWCVKNGHGLGQKEHEADRWVAATAIRLGIPLVAHDSIFTSVKQLELLTKL